MGVALINSYLMLLFLLVHFEIVRFNLFWKLSPFIVIVLILFGLLVPMGWGAPQGTAIVVRNSVAIVPDVAGEVTEVPVAANVSLKAGDVLFRIDPVSYQAQVDAIEAQLKLSNTRLAQMTTLFERDSGRGFDVEQRQSEVDQLKAQLEGAKWNLGKTTVRAPGDGYVTNVALRKAALAGEREFRDHGYVVEFLDEIDDYSNATFLAVSRLAGTATCDELFDAAIQLANRLDGDADNGWISDGGSRSATVH